MGHFVIKCSVVALVTLYYIAAFQLCLHGVYMGSTNLILSYSLGYLILIIIYGIMVEMFGRLSSGI